jgi:hypothetical protein
MLFIFIIYYIIQHEENIYNQLLVCLCYLSSVTDCYMFTPGLSSEYHCYFKVLPQSNLFLLRIVTCWQSDGLEPESDAIVHALHMLLYKNRINNV